MRTTFTVVAASGGLTVAMIKADRDRKRRMANREMITMTDPRDVTALRSMVTARLITTQEMLDGATHSRAYAPGTLGAALREVTLGCRNNQDVRALKRAFFIAVHAEVGPYLPSPGVYMPGAALRHTGVPVVVPAQRTHVAVRAPSVA